MSPVSREFAGVVGAAFLLPRLASGEEKQSQGDSKYFYAAWESFVVFNQPYDNLLPELESAYRKAVAEINQPRMMRSPESPDSRLADHLIAYYWRGLISFESKDRLLEDFYKQPEKLRRVSGSALRTCNS